MSIEVHTLGCRLNFAETEELLRGLKNRAGSIFSQEPKIIVVRGCSVTQKAEKETWQKIKDLRIKNKKAIIVAAGCLGDKFQSTQADFILFKKHENKLPQRLIKILKTQGKKIKSHEGKQENFKLRTRTFIKIQDGCDNFCTYCLVPYLRNKKNSISSIKIIKQIKQRIKEGYQEIILTGVNIGEWQEKNRNFVWLVDQILKQTRIARLRISSLWPEQADDQLLQLFKNPRLCRHLHLSLQSLSAPVLKRMNRPYQPEKIIQQIKKIKKRFSDLSFSTDLIVGFPGETEKEFRETAEQIKKLGFFKLHVFRYSPRLGTAAAQMKNQVNESIKKIRSQKLLILSDQLSQQWRKKFLRQKRKVLFEQVKNNIWQGLTDNYLKVFVKSRQDLNNKVFFVKLLKLYKDGIYGKIIE